MSSILPPCVVGAAWERPAGADERGRCTRNKPEQGDERRGLGSPPHAPRGILWRVSERTIVAFGWCRVALSGLPNGVPSRRSDFGARQRKCLRGGGWRRRAAGFWRWLSISSRGGDVPQNGQASRGLRRGGQASRSRSGLASEFRLTRLAGVSPCMAPDRPGHVRGATEDDPCDSGLPLQSVSGSFYLAPGHAGWGRFRSTPGAVPVPGTGQA